MYNTRDALMGEMVRRHDARAFDTYLWLLKEYEGRDEKDYGLIEVSLRRGQDATVVLKGYGEGGRYERPQEGFLLVPWEYWVWGWSKRLSLAGKVRKEFGFSPVSRELRPPELSLALTCSQ